MAVPGRYPIEGETRIENKSDNYFGLIVEADASVAYLHGYEVTTDGSVVVPELCPNRSKAPTERIKAVKD